jgi:hypothetical protein
MKNATRKPASSILYEGPSMIDGKPIGVIATVGSANSKTGAMVQTWIMRQDVEPHHALKTGQDASVCGDCPHRPANGGACYVTVFQAPLSVYRAWERGRYEYATPGQYAGMIVRIGSYGDPAAVSLHVWKDFVQGTAGHTGYTHQWRTAYPGLREYCMASVDTPSELMEARAAGWRTFRVRLENEPVATREAVCPASHEGGRKANCDKCKACSGTSGHRNLTGITIIAHGAASKVKAYKAMREVIA